MSISPTTNAHPLLLTESEEQISNEEVVGNSNTALTIFDFSLLREVSNPAIVKPLKAVRRALTAPVAEGERNINVLDKEGHFLRYSFPKLSHLDYGNSVLEIENLYHHISIGVLSYERPPVGCHAIIVLHKFRDQSDEDYENLVSKLGCERHALQTRVKSEWGTFFSRRLNQAAYLQRIQERRKQQLAGIQKVVDEWKKKDLFADVFSPSTDYRLKELDCYPEYVACTDEIILSYKRVPPQVNIPHRRAPIFVSPSAKVTQKTARAYYNNLNRSIPRKVVGALPFAGSGGEKIMDGNQSAVQFALPFSSPSRRGNHLAIEAPPHPTIEREDSSEIEQKVDETPPPPPIKIEPSLHLKTIVNEVSPPRSPQEKSTGCAFFFH
ncbi:MAG: hypothetical protein KGJ02_08050 [Verrucomicrobiota bacterium]|nr:hypothetical protein [Verrucomicrobiota bacterium]